MKHNSQIIILEPISYHSITPVCLISFPCSILNFVDYFLAFSHYFIVPLCICKILFCLVDFELYKNSIVLYVLFLFLYMFNSTVYFYNLSMVDGFAFQRKGKEQECYLDISIYGQKILLAGDI